MPYFANRKRPIQVKFFVDEHELAVIKQRMGEFGTNNLSTYLRTMAMEGIFPTTDVEKHRTSIARAIMKNAPSLFRARPQPMLTPKANRS